jgi:hypothetical protein
MISPSDTNGTADSPPASTPEKDDDATGLPWFENWASVYALVVGCFVTYVVLLVVLKQAFS